MRPLGLAAALTAGAFLCAAAGPARIVLVAGKPSHPPGTHEHNAGVLLLEKCLKQQRGVLPVVVKGGWPEDESVFGGARALVFFMDGGKRNPVLEGNRLETMRGVMSKGTGLALLHYAVDVPKEIAAAEWLEWAGGYYETGYSRNPVSDADLKQASPAHPISRGWKDFSLRDEWYHRIRFAPGDPRFTPILTAFLPKEAPVPETVGWVVERKDGGRGFGFTGGHFHANWGHDAFRTLVLNAILWTAKLEVPAAGAACVLTPEDLARNLDDKPAPAPKKRNGAP